MKKHSTLGAAIVAFGIGLAGTASAQDPTATTVAPQPLGETSPLRLSITLAPMPAGTMKGPIKAEADSAFAFGLVPAVDLALGQFVYVGFAPQYIFNVKGKDAKDATSELDLRLRVGGNAKVADTIMLFGYAAPGYGIVMKPKDAPDTVKAAKGLVVGFAAGAMLALTQALYLSGEVGYQVGYQGYTSNGVDVDSKTNYMHVGVGLGLRI